MGYLQYLSFDMSLARGLDYYTGLIYEVVLNNNPWGVGSIGAGGRYDHLVGMFNAGGKDIPCVGISIGVERVFTILEKQAQEKGGLKCTPCSVLVASVGKDMTVHRMRVAADLWRNGIAAEFGYQENPKLQKQLAYALEAGINWVVVVGEEEIKEGKVNLKNLGTHEEVTIPVESVVAELRKQGLNYRCLFATPVFASSVSNLLPSVEYPISKIVVASHLSENDHGHQPRHNHFDASRREEGQSGNPDQPSGGVDPHPVLKGPRSVQTRAHVVTFASASSDLR